MRNIVFDEWKFKKEIELNCQLRHPNLTSFIGFCDQKDERILVYEYMLNGSVYDHLHLRNTESLSWKKKLEICVGAAKGLHYLHTGAKRAIFHCDIKPQNILLDKNMVPKLSHLGFSIQEKVSKLKPKPVKAEILIFGNFFSSTFRANACVINYCMYDKWLCRQVHLVTRRRSVSEPMLSQKNVMCIPLVLFYLKWYAQTTRVAFFIRW